MNLTNNKKIKVGSYSTDKHTYHLSDSFLILHVLMMPLMFLCVLSLTVPILDNFSLPSNISKPD